MPGPLAKVEALTMNKVFRHLAAWKHWGTGSPAFASPRADYDNRLPGGGVAGISDASTSTPVLLAEWVRVD